MHGWCQRDFHVPTYFLPPPGPHDLRRPVDVAAVIANIRHATRIFEMYAVAPDGHAEKSDLELEKSIRPLLYFEVVKTHVSSYTRRSRSSGTTPVFSSLSGLTAAMHIYLGVILGMLDVDWKPFRDLTPYIAGVIIRDFRDETGEMEGWDTDCRDLWLWKALAGWAGLVVVDGHEEAIKSPFCVWIRQWSEHTGVRDWRGAQEALGRVAWPHTVARGLDMEKLWQDILAV